MMPTIEIAQSTFESLQGLAKPFVDTPDDVIRRLIEQAGSGASVASPTHAKRPAFEPLQVDALNPEDLTHTRILHAEIGGEAVRRPKWNGLLHLLHIRAMQSLGTFDAVKRASRANIREGQYDDRGFVYVPEAKMSIQGVEARLAWENTMHLVQKLGVEIEVEFEWHDKDKAAHPGATGRMEWKPTTT